MREPAQPTEALWGKQYGSSDRESAGAHLNFQAGFSSRLDETPAPDMFGCIRSEPRWRAPVVLTVSLSVSLVASLPVRGADAAAAFKPASLREVDATMHNA